MASVLFALYIYTIEHEKKGKKRSELLNEGEEEDEKKLSICSHL